MRIFPSADLAHIEADHFSVVWTNPDERWSVSVYLWRQGEVVYFDTWEVLQHHAWIEEWACSPFGIPVEEMPYWLDKRLRYEIGRA
jgi:hypothetical protein